MHPPPPPPTPVLSALCCGADMELHDGQAIVQWLKSETAGVENVSDLTLVDRAFTEGDVVVRANNPRGQSGSVAAVRLLKDVEYLKTKEVEKGVPASRLTTVTSGGEWAVSGAWLGHVDDTDIAVTVLFADGAVCVVRGRVALLFPHPPPTHTRTL